LTPQGKTSARPEAEGRRQILRAPAGGGRLDILLSGLLQDQSRTRLQQWVRAGRVQVDGVRVSKPGLRLVGGESIEIAVPAPVPGRALAEPIPLDIVFEDRDVIVVNKPPGMVVHPSPGHAQGTLVNAVLAHAPDLEGVGGEMRPGIVHRLDRDTSGLILVAKNERALHDLQAQFAGRSIRKQYLALVDGAPPAREGRVEAAMGRDPRHRQRMAIVPERKGRPAATHYIVREALPQHSLLEVTPETGRTHQIRVHLAFLECPIVGDRVYGRRRPTLGAGRQMLHAWRLTVALPSEEGSPRSFEAGLPEDMLAALEEARGLPRT
jgi:23S rRNA pseudouridine1911/1915/1917 synthase